MEDTAGTDGAPTAPLAGHYPLIHAYPQDVPPALAPRTFRGRADYDTSTFRGDFEVCAAAMGWPQPTWLARCFHYLAPEVSRVAKQYLRARPTCSFEELFTKLESHFEPSPAVYRAELHRFCATPFDRKDPDGVISKFESLSARAAEPPDRLLRLFLNGVKDTSFTSALATTRVASGLNVDDEILSDAIAKFRGWAAIVSPRDFSSDPRDDATTSKTAPAVGHPAPFKPGGLAAAGLTKTNTQGSSDPVLTDLAKKLDQLTLIM